MEIEHVSQSTLLATKRDKEKMIFEAWAKGTIGQEQKVRYSMRPIQRLTSSSVRTDSLRHRFLDYTYFDCSTIPCLHDDRPVQPVVAPLTSVIHQRLEPGPTYSIDCSFNFPQSVLCSVMPTLISGFSQNSLLLLLP